MKISRYEEMDSINESVRKRGELTNLHATIKNKIFYNRDATSTFIECIEEISNLVGVDKLLEDFSGKTIGSRKPVARRIEEIPAYSRSWARKVNGFFVNPHCSSSDKKEILNALLSFYKIEGNVDIRSRSEFGTEKQDDFEEPTHEDDIFSAEIEEDVTAINPFGGAKDSSAICVLGESGTGKSFRIEKTLEQEGHISEVIIPSASTTNLLVQYTAGRYVLSRLGNFILKANADRSRCYTAVFDECHKYIEMINDELLQCISTRRNAGRRFISLDPVTDELFSKLEERNGTRLLPENIGFVFISSKEEVIKNNSDFYNRVDVITIDRSDRDIEFAIDFLIGKIENKNEEYSL